MNLLYQVDIEDARKLFQDNFTCKVDTAPHGKEIEIAVIPWQDLDEKWDNVQVCLIQYPACFMEVYLRKGTQKVLHIGTRSGGVKELWDMVKPIIDLEAKGAISFYPISLEKFGYKALQDEIDRRDNEREMDIQTRHDAEMAQAESDDCAQAEAEAGIEADRERAEAEAMAEAQNAEADAQASFDAEMDDGDGGY